MLELYSMENQSFTKGNDVNIGLCLMEIVYIIKTNFDEIEYKKNQRDP